LAERAAGIGKPLRPEYEKDYRKDHDQVGGLKY